MYHETSPLVWIGFVLFIVLLLVVDLGFFHKKSHTVGLKESILWSLVWVALAMSFSGVLYFLRGPEDFLLFLTGYVIEKSLSVDNLFIFLLIFSHFKIPTEYQHKVLYYGIIGALFMRALFIWGGISILREFGWVIYLFGGFLLYSGLRMLRPHRKKYSLEKSLIFNWAKKVFPTSPHFYEDKFFVRLRGKLTMTPLFLTLIMVELSDLVFALDSIPAILGITSDPFLVFTSNVFAILGLRALYFTLRRFSVIFHYLKYGLSLILMFIGLKMLMSSFYKIPTWITMITIFGVLGTSIALSLINKRTISNRA